MKWAVVWCDRCGWQSPPVDETAAEKFRKLKYCQECKKNNVVSEFKFQERTTFFQGH